MNRLTEDILAACAGFALSLAPIGAIVAGPSAQAAAPAAIANVELA